MKKDGDCMKRTRCLCLIGCLLLSVLLCACSAAPYRNGVAEQPEIGSSAFFDPLMQDDSTEELKEELPAETPRKRIRTVSLTAETEQFDQLMESLQQQVSSLGGYMQDKEVYYGSAYAGQQNRYAHLTVRIPEAELDDFLSQMNQMANVIRSTETSQDVTLAYSDTESQLAALQVEQERLTELLKTASSVQDLLEIEQRLTDIRSQIETLTARLRLYDNQIDYSTVQIDVEEVRQLTPMATQTTGQRIAAGFMGNLTGLGRFLVNAFVFLVSALPILIPVGAVVFLILFLCRRKRKKRKTGTS